MRPVLQEPLWMRPIAALLFVRACVLWLVT